MIIHAKVYWKDENEARSSTDHGTVLTVKTFLEPTMKTLPRQSDPIETVRIALRNEYGEGFAEPTPGEWIYYWEWDPVEQQWKRICVWTATFEIRFGAADVVGVYISEGSEY